jgi:hypothetical protein
MRTNVKMSERRMIRTLIVNFDQPFTPNQLPYQYKMLSCLKQLGIIEKQNGKYYSKKLLNQEQIALLVELCKLDCYKKIADLFAKNNGEDIIEQNYQLLTA